ncbi:MULTISPECIES: sensor histidine kinase [unclassified Microbacterium]|uniref:sensor histidine kinase n=1 Tax=unclassified Microbacterium TaxID=2609290 RepID=UPI00301724E7
MTASADSRSSPDTASGELRLPRPPGVIRRFWARHPRVADVLIALVAIAFTGMSGARSGDAPLWDVVRPAASIVLILACVALVVRRRWPILGFALAATGSLLTIPSGGGVGLAVLAVFTYTVAVYRSTSAAVTASGVTMAAALLASVVGVAAAGLSWQSAANGCASVLLTLVVAALVGANVGNRKRYVSAILDTSRQLWEEREQHARLAASAERTRIAREMHDVVSHSLTVIVALAEGATATPDAERGRAATARIATTARGALDEMRDMLGVLRDDSGEHAPLVPLDGEAVRTAVAAARSAGVPVVLHTSGPEPTQLHVRLAVARVVQEGLTNVIRHAPDAREVTVDIASTPEAVTVEIVNDAATKPVSTGGFGLRGLHERAARLGGTAEAGPVPGGRWRVLLRVPSPVVADAVRDGGAP